MLTAIILRRNNTMLHFVLPLLYIASIIYFIFFIFKIIQFMKLSQDRNKIIVDKLDAISNILLEIRDSLKK